MRRQPSSGAILTGWEGEPMNLQIGMRVMFTHRTAPGGDDELMAGTLVGMSAKERFVYIQTDDGHVYRVQRRQIVDSECVSLPR
jgi:hypothetical protein